MVFKNRDRKAPDFANINLLGPCNADCFFCLGKDLPQLSGIDNLDLHFSEWENFDRFLNLCVDWGIEKLYMTGQTADGLQYRYLPELVDHLQSQLFTVGLRSNGYLAERKIDTIQKMKGEIGYTINALTPYGNKAVMGRSVIPNWAEIIPQSGDNVRISVVITDHSIREFIGIILFIKQFPNVKYVQFRRISTEHRMGQLAPHIARYEQFYTTIRELYPQTGEFHTAQEHLIEGVKCYFWRTTEATCNSFNYFTDGTVSDEYFIVEGYEKYAGARR
jgi:MoaA/NifB/PqqE/SkfB family radical SAM enzyme